MSTSSPGVHVVTLVASLLSAFANGLDVLRRVRRRVTHDRKPAAAKKKSASKDAGRVLGRSLKRGSRDIEAAYSRGASRWGGGFVCGDAPAHTSLATTLLALNAGLVALIHDFLRADPAAAALDYPALTRVADTSREEVVGALGALGARLGDTRGSRRPRAGPRTPPSSTRRDEWFRPRRRPRVHHRHQHHRLSTASTDSTQLGEIPDVKCNDYPSPRVEEVLPIPLPAEPEEGEEAAAVVLVRSSERKKKKGKGTFLGMRLGRMFGRKAGKGGEEGGDGNTNSTIGSMT
ncbi:MAG: hypothetical protein M1813_001543 [Trichoglossum hirsutum]|nr:MAG: hypothetical protein M1813_001543 [Trichoglossum hirsutum]